MSNPSSIIQNKLPFNNFLNIILLISQIIRQYANYIQLKASKLNMVVWIIRRLLTSVLGNQE